MACRIEQEGFEYRGWKLGEEVKLIGEDTFGKIGKIVLFDLKDEYLFMAIEYEGVFDVDCPLSNNYEFQSRVVLEGYEDCTNWNWFRKENVEKITEETPSPQISPIHAKEITEDISVELTELQSRVAELIEIYKQCMSILNNNTN